MKWNIDEPLLERLEQEQQMIFSQALDYAKPGGKIVYATCSLFKRENEAQVEQFLRRHPVELVKEPLLIVPEDNGPDGFFAAVFCKHLLN
jgi:16S rRNA (cytosine967-C5)-methyltransferase